MTCFRINENDPEKPDDEIVEIGVFITDGNLVPVVETGLTVVIKPSEGALDRMNSYVRSMHERSGLLEEIPKGVTLAEAEQTVMDYITAVIPEPMTAQIGGNTIHMDRRFIATYMPLVDKYLHYRSVDVSTIKELCMRWFPDVFNGMPAKNGNHRALADAVESIRELAYYREVLFGVSAPTGTAITAAAESAATQWKKYLS